MKPAIVFNKINDLLTALGSMIQPVLLLVIRAWWGWSFFLTGKGKLLHLDRTTEYFTSLNIPQPHLNALAAGTVECVGGLLLLLGLGSRIVAVPLMFTLGIAYLTAEREALSAIFSDTDKFTGAAPFLFLFATAIIFAFGPGRFSLDALLQPRKPAAAQA